LIFSPDYQLCSARLVRIQAFRRLLRTELNRYLVQAAVPVVLMAVPGFHEQSYFL